MSHRPIIIPDKLKPFIRSAWYIDGSADNAFQNYADGNPGIVFQQQDTGFFDCDGAAKIPGGYVFGQTIKPMVLYAPKDCVIIGMSLYPHVLQSLFRCNAGEITDNFIDLQLLSGPHRFSGSGQLWDAVDAESRLRLIFQYLESLVDRTGAQPDKGMQYAVDRIWRGKEGISFKKLHSDLNISERTFERKFEQHVGISPRMLANISQFRAALQHVKCGKYRNLSDVAYENGYADQSHFIRVFRKFTGISPLQFIKKADREMSESFYF